MMSTGAIHGTVLLNANCDVQGLLCCSKVTVLFRHRYCSLITVL